MPRLVLFLPVAVLALAACHSSNPSANLAGNWKMTRFAADNNHNRTLDNDEIHDAGKHITYKLLADGTGKIFDAGNFIDNIQWSVEAGDWMKQLDASGKPWYYHIDSLSATRLVLRDTVEGVLWQILEKE